MTQSNRDKSNIISIELGCQLLHLAHPEMGGTLLKEIAFFRKTTIPESPPVSVIYSPDSIGDQYSINVNDKRIISCVLPQENPPSNLTAFSLKAIDEILGNLRKGLYSSSEKYRDRFLDNRNLTMTDLTSGLTWPRFSLESAAFSEADETLRYQTIAGEKWRLPSGDELLSISDLWGSRIITPEEFFVFEDGFRVLKETTFWSSTRQTKIFREFVQAVNMNRQTTETYLRTGRTKLPIWPVTQ